MSYRIRAVAGLAFAFAALPGLVESQPAQTPAERGYAVAKMKCSACHALTGVEERPSSGAPPFPEVGRRFPGDDLAARMRVVLTNGHYAMPPRRLTEAEQRDVAAFIRESADRSSRSF